MRYVADVYWLGRPPYHRWFAAAGLLIVAAFMDVAGHATSPFPFAGAAIDAGEPIEGSVEWVDVPVGLLGPVPELDGYAAHPLEPGDPIVMSDVTSGSPIPAGWWAVPVDVPDGAGPGHRVRLVSVDPPLDVQGVVTEASAEGPFATTIKGLVAVPPAPAADVATAAITGNLLVLLGT